MQPEVTARFQRKRDAVFVPALDEWLSVDLEAGACFSLNETAVAVWHMLERPASPAELCRGLSAEFDVTPEGCLPDILRLLERLEHEGLVFRSPER